MKATILAILLAAPTISFAENCAEGDLECALGKYNPSVQLFNNSSCSEQGQYKMVATIVPTYTPAACNLLSQSLGNPEIRGVKFSGNCYSKSTRFKEFCLSFTKIQSEGNGDLQLYTGYDCNDTSLKTTISSATRENYCQKVAENLGNPYIETMKIGGNCQSYRKKMKDLCTEYFAEETTLSFPKLYGSEGCSESSLLVSMASGFTPGYCGVVGNHIGASVRSVKIGRTCQSISQNRAKSVGDTCKEYLGQ